MLSPTALNWSLRPRQGTQALPGDPLVRAMVLSFFGTWWMVLGGLRGPTPQYLLVGCLVAIGMLLLGGAWMLNRAHSAQPTEPVSTQYALALARRNRLFNRINFIQWGAMSLAIVVLNLVGHPEWIVAAIILIVGLHFLPLAFLFMNPLNLLAGALLVFVAAGLPFVLPAGPRSVPLPWSTGAILWTMAALSLRCATMRHDV